MFRLIIKFFLAIASLGSLPLSAVSIWELDPYQVRELINQKIMEVEAETPEVFQVQELILENPSGSTPLRVYLPNSGSNLPIILFIHGGAWVAGNLETHDHLARYLCRHTDAIVCSVGYLNSPEGKFPKPLEQCYDSLRWIVEHANEFRGDASKLSVAGDSAGGNMAAALCLLARDRGGPRFVCRL
jgi:acetyl esterase